MDIIATKQLAEAQQREKDSREKYERELINAKRVAELEKQDLAGDLAKTRAEHLEDIKTIQKDLFLVIREMKKESDDKMIKLMQEQHKMNAQLLQYVFLGFCNAKLALKRPQYLVPRNNVGLSPFCLLINNSTGDEGDSKMENLQSAFKQLGFQVRLENSKQEDDLKATLLQVVAESDKYACIVIVMSSPANVENGHIILSHPTDGKISLKDIWTPFVKKCENENEKPKLLFLEIENDISKPRLTDLQYPSSMDPYQHDFMIAHSLGDGSGSKPFLEMIYDLLGRESSEDIFSVLDDERQKEYNPRVTLKCTFQDKVFLKE